MQTPKMTAFIFRHDRTTGCQWKKKNMISLEKLVILTDWTNGIRLLKCSALLLLWNWTFVSGELPT